MATKTKKYSLADKISSLITAAPTNFGSDDDEAEETKAKVVEQFDESESDDNNDINTAGSLIRRKNVDLLDEIDDRYRGKKVSKKDIYGDGYSDSDSNDDDDDDDVEDDDDNSVQSDNEESDNEEEIEDNNDDDDEEDEVESGDENDEFESDDSEVDDKNPLYRNRDNDKNVNNITVNNPQADVEKGNCVREQLKLWENLLEMRIQLQKCLVSSNKLPQYDVHKEYELDGEFVKIKNDTRDKLMDLLENMLQVQDKLWKNYPETRKLTDQMLNKNDEKQDVVVDDPMDEEICSDTDDEVEKNAETIEDDSENEQSNEPAKKKRRTLEQYENILSDNHNKYIPYRNSVIQLWNDKTRVASGKMNKGPNQSVVKQIEYILSDKSKIIRKTQLKRSEYAIIGKKINNEIDNVDNRRNQEYDPEIYDDDDFYHQLLRELIQHKSADVTDPIQLSKQWIQLQNMRNKMKRKVNTKESKGRRIRYGQIHNKLVNFMAPITINDTWSPLAKTELYNSLFGKIKSVEINRDNSTSVVNNDK